MVDVGDDAEISYLILFHEDKYSSVRFSVISLITLITFNWAIVIERRSGIAKTRELFNLVAANLAG